MKRKMTKTNRKEQSKICNIVFKASLIALFVSVITQIVITNSFVVKGSEFTNLQKRKQVLNEEISDLELGISNTSSLSALEDKAKKLGFVEYTQPIAVIEPSQFAAAR